MRLYILALKEHDLPGYFDINQSHVVRATTPKIARQLASGIAKDEGKEIWLDPKRSTCRELRYYGKNEVILTDSKAS